MLSAANSPLVAVTSLLTGDTLSVSYQSIADAGKRFVRLIPAVILALLCQTAVAESEPTGRICLASIKPPNDQPRTLYNPSGGNPDVTYSVKIADREPIQFPQESGQWLEGLALDSKIPVVIYEDGEQTASFYVDLGRGEASKCVFLKTLYLTWQVWDWSRTGPWCDCSKSTGSE